LDVEVVPCPILREPDGLAMSSRNMLLGEEERREASLIPKLMQEVKKMSASGKSISLIGEYVESSLAKNPIFKLDYFAICNSKDLSELNAFSPELKPIALIACFVGKIRLIDNLFL
jgi:pantoate--beta-alanine ligase